MAAVARGCGRRPARSRGDRSGDAPPRPHPCTLRATFPREEEPCSCRRPAPILDHPAVTPLDTAAPVLRRDHILAVEFSSPDGRSWQAIGGGSTLAAAIAFARDSCPGDTSWQAVGLERRRRRLAADGALRSRRRRGSDHPPWRLAARVSLLLATESLAVTEARYARRRARGGPHIHHRHTDAFYVLEGELTFEVGRGAETITVGAGSLVAAPPGVAHSFRTTGSSPARRGSPSTPTTAASQPSCAVSATASGSAWDIAPVPADGGLPASRAVISRPGRPEGTSPLRQPATSLSCAYRGKEVVRQ